LCALVAGVKDEIALEDALGLASFLVLAGRVPPASVWVDEFVEERVDEQNEQFAERFF